MADITFNGKKRTINEDINIVTFIADNNYKPEHVVVELNEEIIPKEKAHFRSVPEMSLSMFGRSFQTAEL